MPLEVRGARSHHDESADEADHDRRPAFRTDGLAQETSTDSAVTISGLVSEIEAADASGMSTIPWKYRNDEKNSSSPRTTWLGTLCQRNSARPARGRKIAIMKTNAKT